MVTLSSAFNRLKPCSVLVVGDLNLDSYTLTQVKRISPEAPVPVAQVIGSQQCAGSAGNVALNLRALGASVRLLGRIGRDEAGVALSELLKEAGCDVGALIPQERYPTAVKTRVVAEGQQIVRLDHESVEPLPLELQQAVLSHLPQWLEGIHIVAISDYGKGFLTQALLKTLIGACRARSIPVIVDPKGKDFSRYGGASLIKPNEAEAYAAADCPPEAPLDEVGSALLQQVPMEALLITRASKGAALFQRGSARQDFPVQAREVKDVTGAGDTVLAMLAVGMASGLELADVIELCNLAGGIAVETFGCAKVTLDMLGRRLLREQASSKLLSGAQASLLLQTLQGHRHTLIPVQTFSQALFQQLQDLKKEGGQEVVAWVENPDADPHLPHLLASLSQVDFVLQGIIESGVVGS